MQKIICLLLILLGLKQVQARDITFCGEKIPVEDGMVGQKLMSIISRQIPTVNMVQLRQKKIDYFPVIESFLRQFGLPQDFKYLPIVESGFANLKSPVGARGFWQLMPPTARQYGLIVDEFGLTGYDERDDIYKATEAACRKIVSDYNEIVRRFKLSSWVLTAAGYNWGNGNIQKRIRSEGANYFTMSLNPETAVYVYKIIAIKELFEYPELYMKNLGGNVFNTISTISAQTKPKKEKKREPEKVEESTVAVEDDVVFQTMTINMDTEEKSKIAAEESAKAVTYISAKLVGSYKKFRDGDPVSVLLGSDLRTPYSFARQGEVLKGTGWIIDGRLYIGFEEFGHSVVYDLSNNKGIDPGQLKDKKAILVRYELE